MKTKICTKCHEEKLLKDFSFRKDSNSYRNQCKVCRSKKQSDYFKVNKEKHYASIKQYYIDNPWMQSYRAIQYRCNNPNATDYKYYGDRGIKNFLSKDDIEYIWYRDMAYEMKKPTVDRKDNNGHYELKNCQFIEKSENSKKSNIDNPRTKSIIQYDLNGKFIREWNSASEASQFTNNHPSNISTNLIGKTQSSGGFIWRYKYE